MLKIIISGCNGHMGRVVERCTQVNPEKRYKSVLQLMEAV